MNKYKVSAIEEWVMPSKLTSLDPCKTQSPYYFILVDYQELITDQKICRYRRTVEKINDESRIEDASLFIAELQDVNHQIIFHSIEIRRNGACFSVLNDEKISVHQREKSLENHITDQGYTVSLSIDDLRVGDVIDYQATTVIYADEHPIKGKYYHSLFWLNWDCPVFHQHIRVINQSSKSINAQKCTPDQGLHDLETEIIPVGESLTKTYNDLRPVVFENVVPNWIWSDFLLVTTHSEWQELSAYLFNYYKSFGIFNNSISLSDLQVINPEDKIEDNVIKIVRFVQNEVRYKGENHGVFTHTPKSPDLILKNRYGDCKDKANLLVSLLNCIGVKAHLTLVNMGYGIKIGQLNPSLNHFNHMIVHVEINDNEYYFDPTIKKQAGDLSNSVTLDYGYGLILSDENYPLKKLPHNISRDVYWLKHIFDFSKNTSDENTLTIRRVYSSNRANNMRYYLHSKDQELLANEYLKYAKDDSELDLTTISAISIISDNTQLNELKTEEKYAITNLTDDDDNKSLCLPTNIHFEFPTTTNESYPLRIDLDGKITHEIEVIYKGHAQKTSEVKSINNEWFSYRDSILSKDNITYLSSSAIPHRRHVDSIDLKAYLHDVEQLRLRSSNIFPYKTGNYSTIKKMAGGMCFGIFIIMLMMVALNR